MSFKNILVALASSAQSDGGVDFAVSMGSALNAHVRGCSYAIDPPQTGVVLPAISASLVEASRIEQMEQSEAAVKKFRAVAKRENVEASHDILRSTLTVAAQTFAQLASVHDVTVLAQSRAGIEHLGDVFTEAALFLSGRPIIVVPKSLTADFSAERILIAWDGSVRAARAVALAMPILALAKNIKVVVVGEKAKAHDNHAPDLITNLGRHGLEAELICSTGDGEAEIIAHEAKSSAASLIIMGGYGRSRLREFVFGGVTRYMLGNAELPVLMAH